MRLAAGLADMLSPKGHYPNPNPNHEPAYQTKAVFEFLTSCELGGTSHHLHLTTALHVVH